MNAAGNKLVRIPRFDLEGDLGAVRVDDARGAGHPLTEWRGGEMPQVKFHPHGPLIGFEMRLQGFARRALQQTDQMGGAQHRRHSVGRKVDDVFLLDHKSKFAERANWGTGFHAEKSEKYFLNAAMVCFAAFSESGHGSASAETYPAKPMSRRA